MTDKKNFNSSFFYNDKDSEAMYSKIVDLLVVAGYFRARIQSLEPFDKILGGIVWTLTGSFTDVDIEFKEEMNITEKIRVSETICSSLRLVNCPINIGPHQIQGLDLPVIYDILQWSVKYLLETREQRNLVNRKNASAYFKQKFPLEKSLKEDYSCKSTSDVKFKYICTGRLFRPVNETKFAYNDPLRVYFTLIEHGMNKDLSFQRNLIDLMKKKNLISESSNRRGTLTNVAASKKTAESTQISNEDKTKLDEMLNKNIVEIGQGFKRINTSVIEDIFSENMEVILSEIDKFESLQGDESVDRIKLFVKEKERLENNKVILTNQVKEYETELEYQIQKVSDSNNEISSLNESIVTLNKTLQDNKSNLEKIGAKVKSAKISEDKMKFYGEKIKQREDLKIAITKFKKDCLEEKKVYDNQLSNYEKKIQKMNDSENTSVFEEIDRNYHNEYEKLLIKKKDLFEQNKIINLLTRKIQVFPSKLELLQYQKRFGELYDGMNNVSEISRKIMNEINSKEEVMSLLNQKLEMFISLRDAYKSSKSKKEKEAYKVNVDSIMLSLTESLKKNVDRLKGLSKSIEDQSEKLNELQLYENKYMKLIKEYNKEYNKFSGFNR